VTCEDGVVRVTRVLLPRVGDLLSLADEVIE
jgi:hypothetical protein